MKSEFPSPAHFTQAVSQLSGQKSQPCRYFAIILDFFVSHVRSYLSGTYCCLYTENVYGLKPLLTRAIVIFWFGAASSGFQLPRSLAQISAIAFNLISCLQLIFNTAIEVFQSYHKLDHPLFHSKSSMWLHFYSDEKLRSLQWPTEMKYLCPLPQNFKFLRNKH